MLCRKANVLIFITEQTSVDTKHKHWIISLRKTCHKIILDAGEDNRGLLVKLHPTVMGNANSISLHQKLNLPSHIRSLRSGSCCHSAFRVRFYSSFSVYLSPLLCLQPQAESKNMPKFQALHSVMRKSRNRRAIISAEASLLGPRQPFLGTPQKPSHQVSMTRISSMPTPQTTPPRRVDHSEGLGLKPRVCWISSQHFLLNLA